MSEAHKVSLDKHYRGMGYTPWVAEALEGREIQPEALSLMSANEVLEEVLEWHGIIGYTDVIQEAVTSLEELHL